MACKNTTTPLLVGGMDGEGENIEGLAVG